MNYFIHFSYAFCATIAFAVILQAPKRARIPNGIVGAIGWIVYKYLYIHYNSPIIAALISSLIIGSLSAIFAIYMKIPTLILYLPSLIPLVPGGGMYYTMFYLIQEDMKMFSSKAIETTLIALSLATGTYVSTTLVFILNRILFNKNKRKH